MPNETETAQRVGMRTPIIDLIRSKRTPTEAINFFELAVRETAADGEPVRDPLNSFLDREYPIADYPERRLANGSYLSGIEYACMRLGIITRNMPERGLYSSHVRAFIDGENALVNYGLFPEFLAMQTTIVAPLGPDVLPQVVGMAVPFSGSGFMIPYLADSVTDRRQFRVEQGADIPLVSLPYNSKSVKPFIYGKGIEYTYAVLRRSNFTVEAIAMEVQRIVFQARLDRMRAAADVAINGDTQYGGAVGSAQVSNLTALDPGTTALHMTYTAYNAMMPLAQNDSTDQTSGWYHWNTAIGNAASLGVLTNMTGLPANILPFVNLPAGAANATNVAYVRPLGVYEPLMMITNPSAPANMVTLLDGRFALIEGEEIGGQIQEREQIMRNQTQRIYITSSIATGVWHAGGIRVINLNA